MKIAKLILHFNTPELTASLCRMVPDAIVIDNGSTKKPLATGNLIVDLKENFGFTKGWNEAIKYTNDFIGMYDAYWLMNSDIEITPESITRIENLMNDTDVDILTPSFNSWMKHLQNNNTGDKREVSVIEFTAPVIKKKVFDEIGFFDEIFARGYGVEFDYCYRAKQAGFKIYVDDASSFNHSGQKSIAEAEGLTEYSQMANIELMHGMLSKYGYDWKDKVYGEIPHTLNFKLKVAVYTAIFGDYNELKPIPTQTIDANYFCITDNPNLKAPGWKTIVVKTPRADLHPRIRAKFYKIFPWECAEIAWHPVSIYFDGSIQITSPIFIEHCIANLSKDMLLYKHPERTCIYDERIASNALKKYKTENIDDQIAAYRKFYPPKNGLYACGVLVRKHTDFIKQLMHQWWFEVIKYSYQDQLSFPVLCYLNKFTPATFQENQYKNDFFKIFWHDDGIKERHIKHFNPGDPVKISVLMPIYNTPVEYIKEAVKSIQLQSLKDFELVIVNDNNKKPAILHYFKNLHLDKRIKVVSTCENKGIAHALNIGLKACTGNVIVRMDSDDVACPNLLSKQMEYFTKNPDAVVCGVQIRAFQEARFVSRHDDKITAKKAYERPGYWFVNHPGIGFRHDIIVKLGAYGNIPPDKAEDYELWCRVLKAGFEINNMPDVLVKYRVIKKAERRTQEWTDFLENCKQTLISHE